MERSKKKVVGPIDAVPCPWCGAHNDLRSLREDKLLDNGLRIHCDACTKVAVVVRVIDTPQVQLGQYHKGDPEPEET